MSYATTAPDIIDKTQHVLYFINELKNSLQNVDKPLFPSKAHPHRPIFKSIVWTHQLKFQTVRPSKHQYQIKHQTNPFYIRQPKSALDRVGCVHPNSTQTKELCLLLWVAEKATCWQKGWRRQTPLGADWLMSHICPAHWVSQHTRGIEVVLKWVEGKLRSLCRHTEWLNAGIRQRAATFKTETETDPSVASKRVRLGALWDYVCVWQCFGLSSLQHTYWNNALC